MSETFTGFDMFSGLRMAIDAHIQVPNNYSGYVFRIASTDVSPTLGIIVDDGYKEELGATKGRKWNAFLLQSFSNTGVSFCTIKNSIVYNAGTAIFLQIGGTGNGWITANTFRDLYFWGANIFIDFATNNNGASNISYNTFMNLNCQSSTNITYGARNIMDEGNQFINVIFWDTLLGGPGVVISEISTNSIGTLIIGGRMTTGEFIDRGIHTKILDEFHTQT